jgi:hypothetical protein
VVFQNGIQEYSVGFGPETRAVLDAGRTYTCPDFERQMRLSPLEHYYWDKKKYLIATFTIFFSFKVTSGTKV